MLSHERVYLEREEDKGTPLPLVVIDWMLHMIKRCNRLGHLNSAGDYGKNIDNALTYKKSCGNAIKFSHKNIPFALTQVRRWSLHVNMISDQPRLLINYKWYFHELMR